MISHVAQRVSHLIVGWFWRWQQRAAASNERKSAKVGTLDGVQSRENVSKWLNLCFTYISRLCCAFQNSKGLHHSRCSTVMLMLWNLFWIDYGKMPPTFDTWKTSAEKSNNNKDDINSSGSSFQFSSMNIIIFSGLMAKETSMNCVKWKKNLWQVLILNRHIKHKMKI